ncbi:MAG: DUF2070 family protein, partial [Candidatus Thorarchaeota archaeon]|nr:DUF2070 family protein [Candidatus Thorarchaeota archaeon]
FKTWTLFAGHDMLAVTTSAPDFTDDIALEVGVQAADQTRRRVPSLGQVAIVDAHNSISDDAVSVMSGDPEAAMFADSISEAAARTVDMPQTSIEAGVCQIVPEGVTKKDGLGPGGITALVLKQANNTTAFVSVDGNNAEPGFREEMVSMLRRQGVDSAELLTTDTHVVNAISLSSRGYPPVGKAKKQEVLQAIAEAVGCARSKLGEVSLGLGFGAVRGIRTFGEKGFDTLTGDIVEAAGIAKRTGLRTALICYILSLVTMLLF